MAYKGSWKMFILITCIAFCGMLHYHMDKIISMKFSTMSTDNENHEVYSQPSLSSEKEPENSAVTCKFPNIDAFNSKIMTIVADYNDTSFHCDKEYPPDITYMYDRIIKVNYSNIHPDLTLKNCKYRTISLHPYKHKQVLFSDWSRQFQKSIKLTEENEFVMVRCTGKNNSNTNEEIEISRSYFCLIPKNKNHHNSLYETKLAKRQALYRPKETLNLIMIGMDGVSRYQMLRGLKKTHEHLTKHLNSFDFTKHSQVRGSSFGNFVALFTGQTMLSTEKWWKFGKPEDAFNLIWKDYERAGFRTLYTEDHTKTGGFYFGGGFFYKQHTTFSGRAVQLAIQKDKPFVRQKGACLGPRSSAEYQFKYVLDFLDAFPEEPVACSVFIDKVTHDNALRSVYIDEETTNFYKTLEERGHLNKSLVVFFSDHGLRFGRIRYTPNGIVESRNPPLVVTLPRWFTDKYPDIARNLRENTQRLTTHYDTHHMILDTIYFRSEVDTPIFRSKPGKSLFTKIPSNRTCEDASIPTSFCLCGQSVEEYINISSSLAKILAAKLLDGVSENSDIEICEPYYLLKIVQIGVVKMSAMTEKEKYRHRSYRVRIQVRPGGAIFEGDVHYSSKTYFVGGVIERLNMYKGEVECRPTSYLQSFCYCKGNNHKPAVAPPS